MSLGVARAAGSSCTITSYSLLFRVKVLIRLPPSSACRVVATSPTGTPEILGPVAVEAAPSAPAC